MPDGNTDCEFCKEVRAPNAGTIEFGTVIAFADLYPVTEGHTLIVPKRHVEDLFELSETEASDAWRALLTMKRRLSDQKPRVDGFNIGGNIGEAAGQTVRHAHIHLIPRRRGDTTNPRGGVRGVIPEKMNYE